MKCFATKHCIFVSKTIEDIDIFPVKAAFIYTINFLDGSLCQSTLYGGTTYDEHHTIRSNLMNIPKRDFKLETIDELSW